MADTNINSVAFQTAELQSERLRIFGVLAFLGLLLVVLVVRVFVIHTATTDDPRVWGALFLIFAVTTSEYGMLRKVEHALKSQARLAPALWILSTVLEGSVPAWAIAFLPSSQIDVIYRPLATPLLLVFAIFIILSILRLKPWISILSGCVAATSYLLAALYLGWRPPQIGAPATLAQTAVDLNAITLVATGMVAGAIAREIRRHLQAALREAETRRKLDAVQHDLEIARSIQQSLLPQKSPQIPGFEIAGWNQPADETGGDYFDWKSLPNGEVVVSLADVTGHGIGPALLASVCRAYSRAHFTVSHTLTAAFERLNQALGADLSTGRFATFVAAVCRPRSEEVELLSAGHGPLFVYYSSSDRFTEMNAHALPLGILPSFQSDPPSRLQLHSGDLVLLATDGFFEWENDAGEQFGIERMEDVIRKFRDDTPEEIIAKLYQAVVTFSNGTKQQDDLTAVIIKRM
ncbi:MAG TPA: PP2C family protein-serine/threonine phosphatase [Candidatus Sulfotelmatobacter sp.]|nr:PP2C family protein-serine/threonine phosphatase [Candidatus Sulfotelmatobacter sp.]